MSEQTETSDMKKKVLATGLRVGTNVKTKFMKPFITDASPEGLYMINLDITLDRIQTAAKFINQFEPKKVFWKKNCNKSNREILWTNKY